MILQQDTTAWLQIHTGGLRFFFGCTRNSRNRSYLRLSQRSRDFPPFPPESHGAADESDEGDEGPVDSWNHLMVCG